MKQALQARGSEREPGGSVQRYRIVLIPLLDRVRVSTNGKPWASDMTAGL